MDEIFFVITIYVFPLLFAITIRASAQAYMAYYFGDRQAYAEGRVTLNPVKHIDLIGTILIPSLLLFLKTNLLIGWPKALHYDVRRFKQPKLALRYVFLSGSIANLLFALVWAILLRLYVSVEIESMVLISMASFGLKINLFIALFNLIPIPPLDGGYVLLSFLPNQWAHKLAGLIPYGFLLSVLLFFVFGVGTLINEGVLMLSKLLLQLVGL